MDAETRDRDDVYIPAGEARDSGTRFSAQQIAAAFEVEPDRVVRAMRGEFGIGPDDAVDGRMAQDLAEVLLGDLPLDRRQAALMQLGAYAPRSDAMWGVGDGPPTEESDRQSAEAGVPDDDLASRRSSFDPATQQAE
jgi:hypothetical protein